MGWNQQNNFVLLIVQAGTGFSGLFVYSPSPGAGNLIASIAAQASTDPYGNAYKAGITSYGKSAPFPFAEMLAGQLLLGNNTTVTAGSVGGAGGSVTLGSGTTGAGDVASRLAALSKNDSDDGLNPELVTFARLQLQDSAGNPGFAVTMDPATPNADEVPHAMTFQNGWTADATRQKCQYLLTAGAAGGNGAGVLTGSVLVGGSFIVPAGFAAGQAITNAAIAAYQPANAAPLTGYDNTANGPVSFLWRASGILEFHKGLGTAVAAGDSLELPYQLVFLNN